MSRELPPEVKDCPSQCRISFIRERQTNMYSPPEFDKHGNHLTPEMNTSYGTCVCNTCKRMWKYTRELGATTWRLLENEH